MGCRAVEPLISVLEELGMGNKWLIDRQAQRVFGRGQLVQQQAGLG